LIQSSEPFKDHFSNVAAAYRTYRPGYPAALFDWLARSAPGHEAALDLGCGNGQATLGLARHFLRATGVDPAAAQIAQAPQHERISWRVAPAEATGLPACSFDLVTVAQALHWFDQERFAAEVRRVARPGALLAAFTYSLARCSPAVDALLARFYSETLRGCWPAERIHVESGYRTLPFPFAEVECPLFEMTERWTFDRFLGYLGTWSGVDGYRKRHGADPLLALEPQLSEVWGSREMERQLTWPLVLRAGVV
jgi:ubiquinone/menaquinone biosynthesis C-methylase UbiE